MKLNVRFDCNRIDFPESYFFRDKYFVPSSRLISTRKKWIPLIDRPAYNMNYKEMQTKLGTVRMRLAHTGNNLDMIDKDLNRMSFNDHYSCRAYQRCCLESFCPLYGHTYKYGCKNGSGTWSK